MYYSKSREDTKTHPKITQCFKCQVIGDHQSGACNNQQKCVLCAGPHRKAECTVKKEEYKCANCSGSHAAWAEECPKRQEAVRLKKTPTFAQISSATVTPEVIKEVMQELKESIVMLVTEVVARSICELVYEITDRKISKVGLPLKVGAISNYATAAANKLKFGTATKPIDGKLIKERIVKKCFPESATEPAHANSQKAGTSGGTTA